MSEYSQFIPPKREPQRVQVKKPKQIQKLPQFTAPLVPYDMGDPVLNKWRNWFVRGLVSLVVVVAFLLIVWRISLRFI